MSSVTQQQEDFKKQTSKSVTWAEETGRNKSNKTLYKLTTSSTPDSKCCTMLLNQELEEGKSCNRGNVAAQRKTSAAIKNCCSSSASFMKGVSPSNTLFQLSAFENTNIEQVVDQFDKDWENLTNDLQCINKTGCKVTKKIDKSLKTNKQTLTSRPKDFLDDFWSDDDDDILKSGIFNLKNSSSSPNQINTTYIQLDERKSTPKKFEIDIEAQGFK